MVPLQSQSSTLALFNRADLLRNKHAIIPDSGQKTDGFERVGGWCHPPLRSRHFFVSWQACACGLPLLGSTCPSAGILPSLDVLCHLTALIWSKHEGAFGHLLEVLILPMGSHDPLF